MRVLNTVTNSNSATLLK